MKRTIRTLIGSSVALAAVVPMAGPVPVAMAGPKAVAGQAPAVMDLAAVRAGAHPAFDRLVFQFAGGLPAARSVSWVPRVVQDASGKVLHLSGRAFLRVVFRPATAHTPSGQRSWTGSLPSQVDFPVLRSVKLAGDFESVLSFGVGLWQKVPLHVFTLLGPPRLVIDATVPSAGPSRLDLTDNGRLVYLKQGQTVTVTVALRTCVSCGYTWKASALPSPGVMSAQGPVVVPLPHPAGMVGYPSETRWALKATGRGYTALRLYEVGPARGAPPVAQYDVRFVVR